MFNETRTIYERRQPVVDGFVFRFTCNDCLLIFFTVRRENIRRLSYLSFFLSRSKHQNVSFCVTMILRMQSQKILVETWAENIDLEPISSVLRSSLRDLVCLQIARQKDKTQI